MRSVLDRLDREDVRLHQPRYLTLPLLIYEDVLYFTRIPSTYIVGECSNSKNSYDHARSI